MLKYTGSLSMTDCVLAQQSSAVNQIAFGILKWRLNGSTHKLTLYLQLPNQSFFEKSFVNYCERSHVKEDSNKTQKMII